MANRRVVVEFLGKDKGLSKATRDAEGSAGRLGGKMKLVGAAAVAGFAVAVGAAVKFTAQAAALDKKQREVVTLFGETGAAAKKSLGQVASQTRALSDEFGIAQTTLTEGLYSAISAGVPRDNALEFMRVASKAATAGVTDVATTVDGLSSIINAFGLEAKDAEAVSDSMFTTVKDGKTTFKELSDAIFNIAPAAAAAGVSFKEVNAGIAALTAGGTPTSVATTQIRAALVGLQRPSAAMDKIFQGLGYSSAEVALKQEGLKFSLDAVKKASGGSSGKLQTLLGSTEAVSAANVLAGKGADKFADALKNQENSAGATGKAYKTMADSVSVKFDILKTRLENIGLAIGQKLLPFANDLAGWFIDKGLPAMSRFGNYLREKLGPAFREMAADLGPKMRDLWTSLKKAFDDARPGLVILGNFIADVLVPVLWKLSMAVLEKVGPAFVMLGKAVGILGKAFTWLWNNAVQPAVTFIIKAIGWLMKSFGAMLTALGKVPGFGWAKKAGSDMSAAGNKALGLANQIKKIPSKKDITFRTNAASVRRSIEKLNAASRAGKGRSIRYSNGYGGGQTASAVGRTNWRGGLTRVNELGGEIMNLPTGTQIIPHDVSMAAARASGRGSSSGSDQRPIIVQMVVDGKVLAQSLVKEKRTLGRPLGLA